MKANRTASSRSARLREKGTGNPTLTGLDAVLARRPRITGLSEATWTGIVQNQTWNRAEPSAVRRTWHYIFSTARSFPTMRGQGLLGAQCCSRGGFRSLGRLCERNRTTLQPLLPRNRSPRRKQPSALEGDNDFRSRVDTPPIKNVGMAITRATVVSDVPQAI